jgi:hypothetical protein
MYPGRSCKNVNCCSCISIQKIFTSSKVSTCSTQAVIAIAPEDDTVSLDYFVLVDVKDDYETQRW